MTPTETDSHPAALARVLVIEDNEDFAEMFSALLQTVGCSVEVRFDVATGLTATKAGGYNVVFCDIGLPGGMSGLDFAREIRRDPRLAESYLVSVSGHASVEDRERAVFAGFDRVLCKPVRLPDIQEVLQTALRHKYLKP